MLNEYEKKMNENVKRNEKYLILLKNNMDELLEHVDEFNNFDEDDYYDLF